jgi:hypothetical protein
VEVTPVNINYDSMPDLYRNHGKDKLFKKEFVDVQRALTEGGEQTIFEILHRMYLGDAEITRVRMRGRLEYMSLCGLVEYVQVERKGLLVNIYRLRPSDKPTPPDTSDNNL